MACPTADSPSPSHKDAYLADENSFSSPVSKSKRITALDCLLCNLIFSLCSSESFLPVYKALYNYLFSSLQRFPFSDSLIFFLVSSEQTLPVLAFLSASLVVSGIGIPLLPSPPSVAL